MCRYWNENKKLSTAVKKYGKSVDSFLFERPDRIIHHFSNKQITAKNPISPVQIKKLSGKNCFKVSSFATKHKEYVVKFGDVESRPSCECFDFESTLLPCKHFAAVILSSQTESTWMDLPDWYRESAYMTIEPRYKGSIVQVNQQSHIAQSSTHRTESSPIQQVHPISNLEFNTHASEQNTEPLKNYGEQLRERLKLIKNLSFEVNNENTLKDGIKTCDDLIASLSKGLDKESGVVVRSLKACPSLKVRKSKKTEFLRSTTQ